MPSFTRRVPTSATSRPTATTSGASSNPTGTGASPTKSIAPASLALPTLVHTGIPSLDDLLHLPPSSTLLTFSRDLHSSWPRLVARYFLAQGLLSLPSASASAGSGTSSTGKIATQATPAAADADRDQRAEADKQAGTGSSDKDGDVEVDGEGEAVGDADEILILGDEDTGRDLVKGAMWVDPKSISQTANRRGVQGAESGSDGEGAGMGDGEDGADGRSKIAWRYASMSRFRTSAGEKSQLNLSITIPKPLLDNAERTGALRYIFPASVATDREKHVDGSSSGSSSSSSSHKAWAGMAYVLKKVRERVESRRQTRRRGTLRVVVNDLGGWEWDNPSINEIHRFLHALRTILRGSNTAALITLPVALARELDENAVKRLSWAVDACVELKGFADDPSLPPLFHPLHGLLTLHSFPHSTALLPSTIKHSSLLGLSSGGGGSENNLGFRARRKRWGVETVHLGIDGGVGERRTAPVEEMPVPHAQHVGMDTHGGSHSHGHGHGQAQPQAQTQDGGRDVGANAKEGIERATNPPDQNVSSAVAGGAAGASGSAAETPKAKVKKPRARVRFGEEDIVPTAITSEVQIEKEDAGEGGHEGHHGHEHGGRSHAHAHASGPPRAEVRHDRMDLYEF